MASLFNTKISDTYVGLIKTLDTTAITATLKELSDGNGNATGLFINTSGDFKVTATLEWGSLKDTGTGITITNFVDSTATLASNKNDTTIPTSKAVSDYVDAQVGASDLDFSGDSGIGAVILASETFAVTGTTNQITTTASGTGLALSLPSTVHRDLQGNVTGNLTGDVTGNVTGNVTGDLTGNSAGTHTGAVVGNVTGNVTGDLTGTVTATSSLADGVTATSQSLSDDSTKVATTAFVQDVVGTIPAGLVFQGTWNANTNTPTLASGTGTTGHFYIVSVAGTTDLDGVTDWAVGDWAVFVEQGATDQWEKVDNSSVLDGNGTGGKISKWAGSGNSVTLTDSVITEDSSNIGIGTASPSAKLDLRLSTTTGKVAEFHNSVGYGIGFTVESDAGVNTINSETNQALAFATNGASNERMRIDSAGNVGIGVSSPAQKLDVNGNAIFTGNATLKSDATYLNLKRANNTDLGYITDSSTWGDSGTDFSIGASSANLRFYTNNTSAEKMRIDSAGALKLSNYGAGTLVSDASGNITSISGGGEGGPYLPLAGGTMSGNVNYNDNIRARFGTGEDFQVYHDGTDSYINNGNDGGHIYIQNDSVDKDIIFKSDDGSGGLATYITINGTTGENVFYKNAALRDDVKATFGNSNDLQIYHDGNNSKITEGGTGGLYIGSNLLGIQNGSHNETMATFTADGSVDLYYDNSKKFETTSTGVSVTGGILLPNNNDIGWDGGYSAGKPTLAAVGTTMKMFPSGSVSGEQFTLTPTEATFAGDITISNASAPILRLTNTTGSQSWIQYVGSNDDFIIRDETDARSPLIINGSGDSTFAGNVGLGGTGIYTASASLNIDGLGLAIKNDTNGSSNNWSLIKNTDTGSNSNLVFISGQGTAFTINHDTSAKFEGIVGVGMTPDADVKLSVNGQIGATNGTAAAPTHTFYGDDDTGMFRAAANNLAFSSGGSERMRITSDGKLGIGTASPYGTLNVIPSSNPTSATAANQISIGESSANSAYNLRLGYFLEGGAYKGSIQSIAGDTPSTLVLNGDGGNVGISTTSPSSKLHVNNDNDYAAKFGGTGGGDYSIEIGQTGTNSSAGFNATGNAGSMIFKISDTEAMRITSGGNLCVNTTDDTPNSVSIGSAIVGYNDGTRVAGHFATSTSNSSTALLFSNSSGQVGSVTTSGSSTAFNTSSDYRLKENVVEMTGALDRVAQLKPSRFNFIADSDTTIDGFLAHEVQSVVPEAITGTKDGMKDEEYEKTPAVYEDKVHPAIEEEKDEEGNVITEAKESWTEKVLVSEAVMDTRSVPDYQGIDQSKLVPLLVGAIQELRAEIELLKNK